ncbi:MAG: glycosyltransferase 87 family protein [Aggregatilineaceae bacterium]
MPSRSKTFSNVLALLLLGTVILSFIVVMAKVWPIGVDYYFTFYPVTKKLLTGETSLYDTQTLGFYNAPWVLLFFAPLTALSLRLGQALFLTGTLGLLVGSVPLLRERRAFPVHAVLFALLNLHTFDVLIRVQVDGFVPFGVALGWWAIHQRRPWLLSLAFWLMAIKPINVVLVAAIYLVAIRHWSRSEQARVLALPGFSLLVSFVVLGADWPLRYIEAYRLDPPDRAYLTLTLWRIARSIHFPFWPLIVLAGGCVALTLRLAWRVGLHQWTLSIALATNLVFAQYATGNHYVNLIPAMLFLATRSRRVATLAYLATFTPLLRIWFGVRIAPIDLLYPLILLIAAWRFAIQDGLMALPRARRLPILHLPAKRA